MLDTEAEQHKAAAQGQSSVVLPRGATPQEPSACHEHVYVGTTVIDDALPQTLSMDYISMYIYIYIYMAVSILF